MNSYQGISGLVSIIMPAYNSALYIETTIETVKLQSYKKWELIIVDDVSTDKTFQILERLAKEDSRIKVSRLAVNSGAAHARNAALKIAQGEFIAFLDSDDTWEQNKLEKQIAFMNKNNYSFTCTFYNKIDQEGNSLNQNIKYKKIGNYNELLKNCPGNSTVIYNASNFGEKIYIENIRKRNDYLMWLTVIKKAENLYCLEEVLSSHRIRSGSLSKNKFSLIKYHWKIYRTNESLNFAHSLYLLLYWISKPIVKKIIID